MWWWLLACGRPWTEASWLESYGYEWAHFNHRLGRVKFLPDGNQASLEVVGGTSTTGDDTELPAECDPATCQEYPAIDDALAEATLVVARSRYATLGIAQVELELGSEPSTAPLEVALGDAAFDGPAVAWIGGLGLSTDVSLGDTCYAPKHGWLPSHLAVALSEPQVAGDRAQLDVAGAFRSGFSLEEERGCLDELAPEARVLATVAVVVAVAKDDGAAVDQTEVDMNASYEWGSQLSPEPQPAPDLDDRPSGLQGSSGVGGFAAWTFDFFEQDPDGRGAYLRSWSVGWSPDEGWASGHATNYSPGTQLSGFDYHFQGSLRVLEVEAELERSTVTSP